MATVEIIPQNIKIEVEQGANLRTSLIEKGLEIKSPCGGCASCGQCTIVVIAGEENLNEFSFEEKQLLGNVFHITKERLSCQTIVSGDVKIDISAHSETKKVKTIRRSKSENESDAAENEERTPENLGKSSGHRRPKPFKS